MRVNKLQIITSDTCKELRKEDVILPSTYVKTFNKYAKDLKVDLETDTELTKEIQNDLNKARDIINQASEELDHFQHTASIAKDAIEKKDEKVLIECIDDVTSLQENLVKLQDELYSDHLTKVYNRRWVTERFLANEGNFKKIGTFVFIDLNKFKQINDEHGHLVGDNVLIFFTKLLKEHFSKLGVKIVRYAGDEFALFADGIDRGDTQKHVEAFSKSIDTKKLKTADGKYIKIAYSYGLCEYSEKSNFQEVFDTADKRMYGMKESLE